MAIVSSGFVYGAFVIGSFGFNPRQSSAAGAPMPPPGVVYTTAEATLVSATSLPATGACAALNLGTLASPNLLVNGASTGICLNNVTGGYAGGSTMYTLQVEFNHTAANATIFEIQVGVDVTPAANDIVLAAYIQTSAAITVAENATLAVDLTAAGDSSLVSFNVLVTQL